MTIISQIEDQEKTSIDLKAGDLIREIELRDYVGLRLKNRDVLLKHYKLS